MIARSLLVFCSLGISALHGQQPAAAPPTRVVIIPIGIPARDVFVIRQEGGIDRAKQPQGLHPPSQVIWRDREKRIEGKSWLTLNAPAGHVELSKAVPSLDLHEVRNENPAGETNVWATIPVSFPGKSQSAFLLKSDPRKDWAQEIRIVVLPDDAESFPARTVRAINLAAASALVQVGETRIELLPGKHHLIRTPDAPVTILAGAKTQGNAVPVVNTSRKLRARDRLTLVIHPYDGETEPGKPAPAVAGLLLSQPLPDASAGAGP